ncbi:shikimate kinase [Flavicella sp.]|uniref:shikimate kinase n=1 Tax=Flavicella sp. TaxID=2957742 RepID=UPI003015D7EF
MKIVFIGYMASGKSAVAKEVSNQLNFELIDLDAYIVYREGQDISDIFKEKGEIYFRKKEKEYLNEILSMKTSCVLSLGGGSPCFSGNMELIIKKATSFYLRANVATIYNRLLSEKSKRPLVADIADENLQEFIAKHLFERSSYYDQSNYIIPVNDKSVLEISDEVLRILV